MASYSIADVKAIAPFYKSKLKAAGIRSTTKLLERAATPKLRKDLASSTNIPMRLILDWANIADVRTLGAHSMRIKLCSEKHQEKNCEDAHVHSLLTLNYIEKTRNNNFWQ